MNQPIDRSTIPGWGADLDRANRPAVPMERTPPRLEGVHWTTPPAQESAVEILQSTEHFVRPPVFGTTVPPRGISGWIRRRAFRHSENDLRHWLMLLAADRVDAAEGMVADVAIKPGVRAVALGSGAALLAVWLIRRNSR
ncbi:hypothetical protein [Luteibacter sp. 9133]|uniref:hypothetical protein n=1 Tax=Luteibacter sp. 9133 TaxID=1500891 RepID=UPI0005BDC1AA|nr:hypothetical protein [Luteibacter sp. 9133]